MKEELKKLELMRSLFQNKVDILPYINNKKSNNDSKIFIQTKEKCVRIEVKGLTTEFTNSQDWPFKNFMVCAKHSYDKTLPDPPSCYYILNKTRTHAAIVKTNTFDFLFKRTVKCGNNKYVSLEFCLCPLAV